MKKEHKRFIRTWIGPGWIRLAQRILWPVYRPRLVFAPQGWDTPVRQGLSDGWNSKDLVAERERGWNKIAQACASTGPLGFSYEDPDSRETRNVEYHNIHMIFAYALALAVHKKDDISVLDWGGGLGHYYLLAKAFIPDVHLDYSCVEVPAVVEVGKKLNPVVRWYSDERYASKTYDFVMVNASLQYVKDWHGFIKRICATVNDYFLLMRIPVVEHVPGFVAVQNESGTQMLHQQFNSVELLGWVEKTGLKLMREFVIGDRPFIKNAPEQCEMRGWLFRRLHEHR